MPCALAKLILKALAFGRNEQGITLHYLVPCNNVVHISQCSVCHCALYYVGVGSSLVASLGVQVLFSGVHVVKLRLYRLSNQTSRYYIV